MTVRRDNIGNLRGRYEDQSLGLQLFSRLAPRLVRDAGKLRRPIGVVVADRRSQALTTPPAMPYANRGHPFATKKGCVYGSTYLGSRALRQLRHGDLDRTDTSGSRWPKP